MKEQIFFSTIKNKVKQFVIQFAFKIPIRKNLDEGERKALERLLKDLDSEHFQLFEENISQRSPSTLVQAIRQLPVGPGTIMIPSFVFTREHFSFIWPVYIMGNFVLNFTSFNTQEMNRKIAEWIVKMRDVVDNLNCQRTGKIYEIILGPFTQEEKRVLFSQLFSIDLTQFGDLNLTFTKYVTAENFIYNIHTNINYLQPDLKHAFDVRIRVDINNRNLYQSMEPTFMQKVWNFADGIIENYLQELLKT